MKGEFDLSWEEKKRWEVAKSSDYGEWRDEKEQGKRETTDEGEKKIVGKESEQKELKNKKGVLDYLNKMEGVKEKRKKGKLRILSQWRKRTRVKKKLNIKKREKKE